MNVNLYAVSHVMARSKCRIRAGRTAMRNVRDVMHGVRRVIAGNNSGVHGDKRVLRTAKRAMHGARLEKDGKYKAGPKVGRMRLMGSICVTGGAR